MVVSSDSLLGSADGVELARRRDPRGMRKARCGDGSEERAPANLSPSNVDQLARCAIQSRASRVGRRSSDA